MLKEFCEITTFHEFSWLEITNFPLFNGMFRYLSQISKISYLAQISNLAQIRIKLLLFTEWMSLEFWPEWHILPNKYLILCMCYTQLMTAVHFLAQNENIRKINSLLSIAQFAESKKNCFSSYNNNHNNNDNYYNHHYNNN